AGFHVLNIVAEARYKNDHYAIGEPYDVNFILANANGFNEDLALACRVEEQRNFGCGAREATKKSASSHGANEDSRVTGVRLHADTVAQYRSASVRTGGIDGDHANGFVLLSMVSGDAIDQRAFAGARSAGDPGEIGCTGEWKEN